jgi:2-polyprenyl-3-methyl-5-hydroxy-6-metoxy-1,4-benzoquinol methylase
MLDTSRQWGHTVQEIKKDHVNRYRFAERYVTGRTLDAACGCGYGSKILLETASEVVGVDDSIEAIEWAREFFRGPQFIKGRIEESPWSGQFETVVSLETLEHLQEPEEALKAFRRACVGTLIASVPNEDLYPFKAETFANDDSPHYRHYTPEEFQDLLERHGFKVTGKYCQVSKIEPEVVKGTDGRYLIYVCSP